MHTSKVKSVQLQLTKATRERDSLDSGLRLASEEVSLNFSTLKKPFPPCLNRLVSYSYSTRKMLS